MKRQEWSFSRLRVHGPIGCRPFAGLSSTGLSSTGLVIALLATVGVGVSGCALQKMAEDLSSGDPNRIAQGLQKGTKVVQQADQARKEARREVEPKEEYHIGRTVAARVLGTMKPVQVRSNYLEQLVGYAASQSRRPVLFKGYSVQLVDSKDPIALTTSGGHIIISTELIRRTNSEDALAGVIAHEVAHLGLNHHSDTIWRARMLDKDSGAMGLVQSSVGESNAPGVSADVATKIVQFIADAMLRKHDQRHEFQSDIEAVRFLHRVGYDPKAFRDFLATAAGQSDRWAVSTHPPTPERVKAVDQEIARLGGQAQPVSARGPASEPKAKQARQARFEAFKKSL